MRWEREDKQREEEGRKQHQERESVFVVGVCRSGKLRVAVLPAGTQIYSTEAGNHTLAVKALGHKLARASYYVMRDQVEFDPRRLFG